MPKMPPALKSRLALPGQPEPDANREYEARRARLDFRGWYKLPIWRDIRRHQLATEPLCRMCNAEGLVTAASVCDHVHPHRGNWDAFVHGPFQSLCASHHSRHKQREEQRFGK